MKTWRIISKIDYTPCIFRTKPDFKMTGRMTWTAAGEDFAVPDSEEEEEEDIPYKKGTF